MFHKNFVLQALTLLGPILGILSLMVIWPTSVQADNSPYWKPNATIDTFYANFYNNRLLYVGDGPIPATEQVNTAGIDSQSFSITVESMNVPPTVTITTPADGTMINQGDDITIMSTASDSDGSVTRVEFYVESSMLGEDTSAPYIFTWTSIAVGSHSLTAVAIDNSGATTTSSPVIIAAEYIWPLPEWSPATRAEMGMEDIKLRPHVAQQLVSQRHN